MSDEKLLIPAVNDDLTVKRTAAGEVVFREVRLGRKPADPAVVAAVPRLAMFLDTAAYEPPAKVDYVAKARPGIGMHGNDRYGDCVLVGKVHAAAAWSANDNAALIDATDQETVSEYFRICGPGDNGCVIAEVLNEFRDRGILMQGKRRRIDGYVALDNANVKLVKAAITLFGGITIGFNVPREWMSIAVEGGLWDTPRSFSFVGGHDVRVLGYDDRGVQLATWGVVLTMTWRGFADSRIVDEAYCELSPDWTNVEARRRKAVVDVAKLRAALDAVGGGRIPEFDPTPPPSPPVPPPPPPPPVNPVYDITVSGPFPAGIFGGVKQVTLTGSATPHASLFGGPVAAPLPWLQLIRLAAKVVPIVVAGIQAGKSLAEIVQDVLAVIVPQAPRLTPEQWLALAKAVVEIVLKLLGR